MKIVDMQDFFTRLVKDVETVEALRAKIRPMLEDEGSTDYVQPDVETNCTCERNLRAHLQDIMDDDQIARLALGLEEENEEGWLEDLQAQFPNLKIFVIGP